MPELTAVSLPFREYGSSVIDQGQPGRISPTKIGGQEMSGYAEWLPR